MRQHPQDTAPSMAYGVTDCLLFKVWVPIWQIEKQAPFSDGEVTMASPNDPNAGRDVTQATVHTLLKRHMHEQNKKVLLERKLSLPVGTQRGGSPTMPVQAQIAKPRADEGGEGRLEANLILVDHEVQVRSSGEAGGAIGHQLAEMLPEADRIHRRRSAGPELADERLGPAFG